MTSRVVLAMLLPWALPFLPAQTANGYAAADRCAICHRQISESYALTGMARAFYKPAAIHTIEDYKNTPTYYHSLSGTYFSMTIRDGRYFQRRWQLDSERNPINVEELQIDYVMGSGNHARSYLHRTERGMLIELPLGWYPDGPGWGMVPGSGTEHPQTRRFVSYKCMFCHNGYPAIPAGNEAPGSDPVFVGELPQGIDCQRCHGPGAEHVRTAGRAAIVNPAKLSPERRMEVCFQCHMETTSGRIPAFLQRFDRGTFSFIPGQPLAEFALAFDHAPNSGHEGKFEAVSSVYRLRQSRCFLESAGKLECATCHDPHRIPRGEEAARFYSSVCLKCHSGPHPTQIASKSDCTSCHMPKRRVDDAPPVIMTDHLIQKRAPANALTEFAERPAEEYLGELVPYYPSPLPETPRNELYRAVAQVGLGNNVAKGMPELIRWLDEVNPLEPEFYMVLGDGWKFLGNARNAAAAYERALELKPDSTRALRALAAAQQLAGDRSAAEATLAHAVEIAPADPESWFRYGVLTSSAARIEKAIQLDPWLPDQSRRLAEVLDRSGRVEQADSALKDALRTDPFDDAAWDLGGRILTEKKDFTGAFFDFERAIKLHPNSRYFYDYALALVRAGRFDEAQEQAEIAVRADSGLAEGHELLGGLYARKQQLPEAIREYQAALTLKPELQRVRLRLAAILATQALRNPVFP
jgi:tetratricopeptide (TPR) repeat protein